MTEKGVVLVIGCSHPETRHILDNAEKFGEIYGIIGGLHGFSEYKLFEDLKLICPRTAPSIKLDLKRNIRKNTSGEERGES